jgi:hypothetical protein
VHAAPSPHTSQCDDDDDDHKKGHKKCKDKKVDCDDKDWDYKKVIHAAVSHQQAVERLLHAP